MYVVRGAESTNGRSFRDPFGNPWWASWWPGTSKPICLRLFWQVARLAASRTFWTAGRSRPIRTAMIAKTTSNSIKVKPLRWRLMARLLQTKGCRGPVRERRPYQGPPQTAAEPATGRSGPPSADRDLHGSAPNSHEFGSPWGVTAEITRTLATTQ